MKKKLFTLLSCALLSVPLLCQTDLDAAFLSPSEKQTAVVPFSEIEASYSLRKVSLGDRSVYQMIADNEKEGFIGYHGDSLDFLIYQDIIRIVFEEILGQTVKAGFHFLAVPLDPALKIQNKGQLAEVFTELDNPAKELYESTFPLNFTIWGNHNRLGHNTIENFSKDEPSKPLGYRKRLTWFFKRLGISEKKIDSLFQTAYEKLPRSTGVILQVFDESEAPYALAKRIAYPAYPNGYIAENRTVDEYFLDEAFLPPYPHEVRLMLNNKETLNPKKPLKVVRYTPHVSQATLASYEKSLRSKIKDLSYSSSKKSSYLEELKNAWYAKSLEDEL